MTKVANRLAFTFLSIGILALGGCSDDGPTNGSMGGAANGAGANANVDPETGAEPAANALGDGPGEDLTMEEYCALRVELETPWCDYIDECCIEADKSDLNFVVPTCSFGQTTISECMENLNGPIEAGAEWDGTWAAKCVQEYSKAFPDPPAICVGLRATEWLFSGRDITSYGQIESCQQMLQGKKAEGEECDYEAECGDGLICTTLTRDGSGTFECFPVGTRGDGCQTDGDCEAGLQCVSKGFGRQCGDLGAVGAACEQGPDCQNGLVCVDDQCAEVLEAGDSCEFSDVCEGGYGCGFLNNTCISLGFSGQSCLTSGQCQGRCDNGTCTDICGGDAF